MYSWKNSRFRIATALAATYVLGMANFWFPTLRFTWPLANAIFFLLLQIIPLAVLFLKPFSRVRLLGGLSTIVLVSISILSGLLGFGALLNTISMAASGGNPTSELIESVALPTGPLAVYRTNGGAMTSFGITVRQECVLIPGILLVRRVWDAYPASRAEVRVLDSGRIEIYSPPYRGRTEELIEEVDLPFSWCRVAV